MCKLDPWWADAPGWEYDLVRLLPPSEGKEVCTRAWRRWYRDLLTDDPLGLFMMILPPGVIIGAVWFLTAALGLGPGDRLLAELAFHLALARPYYRNFNRLMLPRLRPYIRDELFLLVEEGLSEEVVAAWWDALASHPDVSMPLREPVRHGGEV